MKISRVTILNLNYLYNSTLASVGHSIHVSIGLFTTKIQSIKYMIFLTQTTKWQKE